MDYKIIRLVDGNRKQAWDSKDIIGLHGYDYRVTGKTARYINEKGKEVKGEPRLFKFCEKGKYGILLLVKNIPEKFVYNYKAEREKAWKGCMELMSANTANPKKLLTIITSYLDGTNGLQKLSTSPKITKDFAESATLMGKLIATPIVSLSGKENARNTEDGICWHGSKAFPSKIGLTFWAKVNLKRSTGFISEEMERNDGKVILLTVVSEDGYKHGSYYYYPETLEPLVKKAAINTKDKDKVTTKNHQDSINLNMEKDHGKIMWFKATYKEGDWWKPIDGGWNFHESWLDFDVKEVNDDDLESGREKNSDLASW